MAVQWPCGACAMNMQHVRSACAAPERRLCNAGALALLPSFLWRYKARGTGPTLLRPTRLGSTPETQRGEPGNTTSANIYEDTTRRGPGLGQHYLGQHQKQSAANQAPAKPCAQRHDRRSPFFCDFRGMPTTNAEEGSIASRRVASERARSRSSPRRSPSACPEKLPI